MQVKIGVKVSDYKRAREALIRIKLTHFFATFSSRSFFALWTCEREGENLHDCEIIFNFHFSAFK
jgi:hypothetical protein